MNARSPSGLPRLLASRRNRLIGYLLILIAVAAWRFVPRPWHPTVTMETPHYAIASTATRAHTEEIGRVVEELYSAYSNQFYTLASFAHDQPKLKMKLFKNRDEFRRINPGLGWAEAFYRKPYCRAYYSASEVNPCHWMLHEAVHQLNAEVAHLELAKWLEEGLADYFATSRFLTNKLALGHLDPNTYPIWWIDEIATAPDLASNLQNKSVIPLRAIVSGSGGPSMNRHFNLYYLHWWTLTHFIFETPKYRDHASALMKAGGGTTAFAEQIGPLDQVQTEWHLHVRKLKAAVAGHDLNFFKTGQVPNITNRPPTKAP